MQVELRRGAITMSITCPTSAAAEFALWTREVLR
jgi:transposase